LPKVAGLQISGRGIVLRLLQAVLASMAAFIVLFYLPTVLPSELSGFLVTNGGLGSQVLHSLISPTAPTLGLFIVILVFTGALLRGSSAYGLLLVLNGLAFVLYVYSLFQGGVIRIQATGNAFGSSNASVSLSLDLTLIMLAFMIPPALTVVKGVILMRSSVKEEVGLPLGPHS
jgi:hypothetical protein